MCGFSDDRAKIMNFRVDRMCSTQKLEEDVVPLPEDFDMEEYVQRQFRMFQGEETEVVLKCENDMMRYIVDQFGENAETWKSSEDTFCARVNVADSPTFYSWVFGFVGDIRILEPATAVKTYRRMLYKGLK